MVFKHSIYKLCVHSWLVCPDYTLLSFSLVSLGVIVAGSVVGVVILLVSTVVGIIIAVVTYRQ